MQNMFMHLFFWNSQLEIWGVLGSEVTTTGPVDVLQVVSHCSAEGSWSEMDSQEFAITFAITLDSTLTLTELLQRAASWFYLSRLVSNTLKYKLRKNLKQGFWEESLHILYI